MNHKPDYRQLASEITEFCEQRLQKTPVKPSASRSLLHTFIAAILTMPLFSGGGTDSVRKSFW